MKKYLFKSIIALVAAAGFVACSDDDVKYDGPGQWDANADYANVYFKQTSYSESIDPSAPTEYTFKVYRRVEHQYTWGKDAEGNDSIVSDVITTALPALTAKPSILTNTNDAFTVSDAVFAEGDTVTTVTAQFPTAAVGTPHTLKVTFQGADLVSSYSQSIVYTYTVTRVKWNNIGKGKFRDDFYFESSWDVEIMQRDDDKSYYRIMDPFGGCGETLNGEQSEYVELHVLKKGDKITDIEMKENGIVDWYRICTGYVNTNYNDVVYCLHPKNFTSSTYRDYAVYSNNRVTSYLEDGSVGQIQLAPSWYMLNTGGWNYTTTPTIFINFPGFVETYEASIDEDFEFADEYEGVWKSNQLGTTTTAMLQKGTCVTTTDDCDKTFEETYGTPYIIKSPYAEGYDLLFCAKGKKILLAPEYEDPQPLGIQALGNDVYAIINTGESSFADGVITLNITFTNEDGDIEYGTSNEQLLNLTYTVVGTGVYTYGAGQLSKNAESFYEGTANATLYQCDQLPGEYYLTPWAKSEAGLPFTVRDDNTIKFFQSTGEEYEEEGTVYGTVYFFDIEEYNPGYASYLGQYDAEAGSFTFNGAYYIPNVGGFGLISETFVLRAEAPATVRSLSSKDMHLDRSLRAASPWVARKVTKSAGNTFGSTAGNPHFEQLAK